MQYYRLQLNHRTLHQDSLIHGQLVRKTIAEMAEVDGWQEHGRLFAEAPAMHVLIKALADEYTGREPLALLDTNLGQWAEEILARIENRKEQSPQ